MSSFTTRNSIGFASQSSADTATGRLESQSDQWQQDVEERLVEIKGLLEQRLEDVRDAYIGRRLARVILLLIGVPVLAVANLV